MNFLHGRCVPDMSNAVDFGANIARQATVASIGL
jgi:hypothetical protein